VVWRGIALVFAILLMAAILRELRAVIVQLLLAILIASATTPVVDALTTSPRAQRWRWRPSRSLAALVVFLGGVVLVVVGALVLLATVAPDLSTLSVTMPGYVRRMRNTFDELLAANPELAARVGGALPSVQDLAGSALGLLGQASRLLTFATGLFSGVLYSVFTLILALYITIDGNRIRLYVVELLPFDRHAQALTVSERIGVRLGAWARGEAVLATIIGLLTWLGTLALGLPYAGALAIIAAVGELIPTLGPIIAAVPLVIVGFLSSPQQGFAALALAILIQQLENNLIVPRVMGQAVNLHPVVVMVAILSGNELLGIPGALLAVPVVAALSVVVDEVQRERRARAGSETPSAVGEAT
jgi:predicted PurR-regulated permease PerM